MTSLMMSRNRETNMQAAQTNERFRLLKKRGAEIVRSLLTEGYMLITQAHGCEFVSLKHKQNGNRIVVECTAFAVYVFKNGRLIKLESL